MRVSQVKELTSYAVGGGGGGSAFLASACKGCPIAAAKLKIATKNACFARSGALGLVIPSSVF